MLASSNNKAQSFVVRRGLMQQRKSFRVVVVTPFEQPNAGMAIAAARAGALGIVGLGRDARDNREALREIEASGVAGIGVRISAHAAIGATPLPSNVDTVIVEAGVPVAAWAPRAVMVEVTSVAQAHAAVAAGACALIAKGTESGGRVGGDTTFVLVQALAAQVTVPIYAQGGIGVHTAAACIAGGAAGVVVDAQLALVRESSLSSDAKAAIAAMDGSETLLVDEHRVYTRPDLPVREIVARGVAANLGARDLRRELLPAGQDAAFARSLAARFRSTGGVVRGLVAAIDRGLVAACEQRALAADAPLAARYGLRYPILQGPMTRVSDQPAFADAIAGAGALPFLSLALMRGAEVDALLAETTRRLAGKTWGVGILGFVPQALRDEQLAAVLKWKPPVALIAGGRPAQAKPLEDAGTRTFLHTPSPGLLDLFLKQGARRFVFEGSECGGHVGPRTSLALWELQIERLLAQPTCDDLEVVFAGGIHDARSAAMVAAMAAPLVARGAAVGVLMGTAYLFSVEAVACGAIQPAFQEAALACTSTVLLETAPGHATRCADTEFVRYFQREHARLQAEGVAPQAMWQQLEELNLGRLRIAAKGLVREGDKLVTVDADVQRREGMVMLGQIAALRDAVLPVAQLHADVADGAQAHLDALSTRQAPAPSEITRDVAIVGMAAIMPGAPDLETFWSNIVHGVNSIREVPTERWRAEAFFDPASTNGEMTPSKWGGFLDPYPFDPLPYGIPPRSLAAIEPVQLLALEASRRALDDAGYGAEGREFDRDTAAVIFGAEAGTDLASAYGFRALWRQYVGELPPELAGALPSMTEDSFPGILANVIAGRVANRLDLGGSNYTVDAACASSLAAVDVACKELVSGSSDMVVCGGADMHNSIVDYLAFSSVHALSPTGQCRTFDAAADGIALGEGVAAIVLKRLADAERDGDRIYAVIKGVGGASDGKSLGLTAPRAQGQQRTLERAYRRAGVSPRAVGLVEAHGTGTVVGDRTELETLNRFFGEAGVAAASIALGSVKSQIGHTKCAAGVAGLVKAALALQRQVLPPTLNITQPNPGWTPASPFVMSPVAKPWPVRERYAGVSAFGFGGTNFHVVLASHDAEPARFGLARWPAELFLIRGADRAAALDRAERVARAAATGEWSLAELARAAAEGSDRVQIALVARDATDLAERVAAAREGKAQNSGVFLAPPEPDANAKLAFVFPGQGSQRVGMLGELFVAFPDLQRHLESGAHWKELIFPPTAWTSEAQAGQQAALTDTRAAQPALGIAGLAMASLLQRCGVRPDMVAGHSYGELVALTVAGALPEAALPALSELRGRRILEACADADDAGTMAAVAADRATIAAATADIDGVVIANENSPEQSVISGPKRAVEAAVEKLLAASIAAKAIPVACAFHSPLVRAACAAFAHDLAAVDVAAPALPVYANTTAGTYPADPAAIRELLAQHIGEPVRFAAQIEAMYAAGTRIFVEAGPGRVLTGLVGRILGKRPHVAIACDRPGEDGVVQFLLALGQLAVHGVPVDGNALFAPRDVASLSLDAPPAPRRSASTWWVNGQRAWPMQGEVPGHALRPIVDPIPMRASYEVAPPQGERDVAVLDYLRNVRELVDAQRRVMLSYLGSDPGAGAALHDSARLSAPDTAPATVVATIAVDVTTEIAPVSPAGETLDVEATLLAIVSERTGYPLEMLDLDLDLEADLSIDSIKRVEILGAVAERLRGHAGDTPPELPEDLVAVKTLRGIVESLAPLVGGRASVAASAQVQATAAASVTVEGAATTEPVTAPQVDRYVVELTPATDATHEWRLTDRAISIVGGLPQLDALLAQKLSAAGTARAVMADRATTAITTDALVDLTPLRSDWKADDVPVLFRRIRAALMHGASHVIVAGTANGYMSDDPASDGIGAHPSAGGVSGMIKSLRKEWPDRQIRVANFATRLDDAELATRLVGELNVVDDAGEVGYSEEGERVRPRIVRASLEGGNGADGDAVHAAHRDDAHGVRSKAPVVLGPESVVLITGGARGITAAAALALAERFGCRLELVGRTALPGPLEADDLAGARDARAVRQVLIARGTLKTPAEIEAACARILAEREVRTNMAALAAAGSKVTYHPLDVRDTEAFERLIDDVYARHGRLDGVIHGAGVIEDKLARDKTPDSFARVFETKVHGALAIARKVRPDIGFIVFFSSIASTFGSRGQVDYAAANDYLDRLAAKLNAALAGRVLSINWGPWGATGMMSPELEREYARRGIGLIDPAAGVASFMDELLHGSAARAQVILMRGDPGAMA
ncbi:MAG: SDR family NAD(P)-dependent oxidoreductase [Burkholderiales bacterium]|nr:SDR family NAD(P)-dependent oxidoreductase [Burkholderiales bacterium]